MIGGPYRARRRAADTPSRRKVFVCRPDRTRAAEEPCATKILSTLARARLSAAGDRAESRRCSGSTRPGRAEGGFDAGIQRGLERILAAPSFLFRVEREPADCAPGTAYRLERSRPRVAAVVLPVEQHPGRRAAERGGARQAAGSGGARAAGPAHAARSASQALVDNFANQWLELGKLAGVVPDVDDVSGVRREPARRDASRRRRLFVGSQLRDDRSVIDLLTADYTFLNERLATHYGIPNIYGSHFRRVTFADGMRGGLLGQASILTVTSYPEPHVARRARPMAAREHARRAAAAAAARCAGAEGSRRRRRSRDRCASGWRCTGRIRRARSATCGWIRSGSRSRISTRSASGARRATARRSTRRRRFPTARRFEGVAGLRTLLVSHRGRLRPHASRRSCWPTRSAAASSTTTCPPSARSRATRRRTITRWSAIITGIVKSTPFSMSTCASAETRSASDAQPDEEPSE